MSTFHGFQFICLKQAHATTCFYKRPNKVWQVFVLAFYQMKPKVWCQVTLKQHFGNKKKDFLAHRTKEHLLAANHVTCWPYKHVNEKWFSLVWTSHSRNFWFLNHGWTLWAYRRMIDVPILDNDEVFLYFDLFCRRRIQISKTKHLN